MKNLNKIPNAELFADLQMSLVDIALMEMLKSTSYTERYQKEKNIAEVIKAEIKQRFLKEQIMKFLKDGYPRQVNLTKMIKGGN